VHSFSFDFLTGTINVPVELPTELVKNGLEQFYVNPNSELWGKSLCRVLYHESIHFWQLLGSGYLARIVRDEWDRVLEFEESGNVPRQSFARMGFTIQKWGLPSAYEMLECAARYWDVHTRSPAVILEEEEIPIPSDVQTVGPMGYSHHAYDLVMSEGPDAKVYAAPYRALLKASSGHSRFVAYLFPIISFVALGTEDPSNFLFEGFRRSWNSLVVQDALQTCSRSINLDWYFMRVVVEREVLAPMLKEIGQPAPMAGFGALESHPVLRDYKPRLFGLSQTAKLGALKVGSPKDPYEEEAKASCELAGVDPSSAFMFPGQPSNRWLLGHLMQPPAIRFANTTVYNVDTEVAEDVAQRVRNFRVAEFAAEHGLSSTAFAG
jgi:hypothetical protein